MTSRALLLMIVIAGCKSSSTPAPTPAPAAAVISSDGGGIIAMLASSSAIDLTGADHEAAHRAECPSADAEDRDHCVWLKPVPGVTTVELKRRLKAAGFEAEAETDKVYAYWKPATIESFFGVKPGYVRTGGSSGGMICMMVLPKGARPATKGVIAGWAIDDPVCEM